MIYFGIIYFRQGISPSRLHFDFPFPFPAFSFAFPRLFKDFFFSGRAGPESSRGFSRRENQDQNSKITGENRDKKAGKSRGAGGNGESFPGEFQENSRRIPGVLRLRNSSFFLEKLRDLLDPSLPPSPILGFFLSRFFPLPSPPLTGKFRKKFRKNFLKKKTREKSRSPF